MQPECKDIKKLSNIFLPAENLSLSPAASRKKDEIFGGFNNYLHFKCFTDNNLNIVIWLRMNENH